MRHQPFNGTETTDDTLRVKAGDTFKCGCSINQIDSNGDDVWFLNSWMFKEDGWYHLGSTDGSIIEEKFHAGIVHDWVKVCGITDEPIDTLREVVSFT
jgi:hypothetical protein